MLFAASREDCAKHEKSRCYFTTTIERKTDSRWETKRETSLPQSKVMCKFRQKYCIDRA
jgi:hypothetical protein